MSSDPVIVLYKAETCGACKRLSSIWDSIVNAMKVAYPNIRFFVISSADRSGVFELNTAPKGLLKYRGWFPMVLLVPGPLWNEAMANLGPNNMVELTRGVQVFNGKSGREIIGQITAPRDFVEKYDMSRPQEWVRWLTDAMQSEDFIQVQNGLASIPTLMNSGIHGKLPKLSNIIDDNEEENNNYIGANNKKKMHVCTMKIVPLNK